MSELPVRRLLIDLSAPFDRRWNGGDAFRSAFFNALSMSFPAGEQFFIDSVRDGMKVVPPQTRADLAQEVQGFVGQEATHRHIHAQFNGQLAAQGFVNKIEGWSLRRRQANAHLNVRMHVAGTAGTEHLTAIFADWMLRHPEALEGAEPRLRTLWEWHSAEEAEHRSTAFDVYQALGGSHKYRVRAFVYITVTFSWDLFRQTLHNLWVDGSLFHGRTWRSAWRLLLSKDGMLRSNVSQWRAYFQPDFHPRHQEAELSRQWLVANAPQFRTLSKGSAA